MSFSRSRPRSAKYGRAHALLRAQHMQALREQGEGRCAEPICVSRSRRITASMGSGLHLCHERATGRVLGLGHARCNMVEAARYARARQTEAEPTRLDWD